MSNRVEKQLRNFLEARWLRPEGALFGTLKSRSMDRIEFKSPSVDISCGEGSLMFQHLGGEFEFDYDMYRETKARDFKHDQFIDIYDCDREITPPIRRAPDTIIDFGTDWKQELLNKASRLGVYKDMVLHDNNILPLPFENEQLETVFSTSLYWIKNIEGMLADIHRILRPGGRLATTAMTPLMLNTLDKLRPILTPKAISILDRSRSTTMPGGADAATWEGMLKKAGFRVEHMESVFPTENLIDVWNIGMRPVSHLLIQMSEELSDRRRAEIKQEWIEIFYELLLPLVSLPNICPLDKAPYLMIIAEKA